MMIGAIFFAGKPEPSFAQNYLSYELKVYCGNRPNPEQFWYNVKGDKNSMGVSPARCAGNCPGGKISLEDALAGLPAEVSTGLRAEVAKHEAKAAAGKASSIAKCVGNGKDAKGQPPQCEDSKACSAIGQAVEAAKRAYTSVGAGSIRFNTLKSELNPILNEIDELICLDNQGAHYIVHRTRITINGREPDKREIASTLERIEQDLTRLQRGLCTAGPTPDPSGCKPPEEGMKPYEDLARGDEGYPDTHTPRGYEYVPGPGQEFGQPPYYVDAAEFMPLQPCPGCRWQLLAILNKKITSKTAPVWQTRTVWHCPSNNETVVKNDFRRQTPAP